MSFSEKYKIQPIVAAPKVMSSKQSPEERARARLMEAIKLQQSVIEGEKAGKPVVVTRNGKSMKPRTFWMETPAGIAFTPRFGNEFLFEKGSGVILPDMDAISEVLVAFGEAVQAGEFDARMMEILNARSGRGVAEDAPAEAEPKEKKRGRPKST